MSSRRVVVTGMGALTPIGNNLNSYWNGLISGTSGCASITQFDASNFKTKFACELKGFDPADHFERKEYRRYDKFSQYGIVAASEAIDDSKIIESNLNHDRIGVIWGAGIGGLETFQNEVLNFSDGDGTPRFNPFMIPKMIPDIAAGLIAIVAIFVALRELPLATVVSITFASPIFTTILSIFLLSEKVGLYRWIAVVIGLSLIHI